MFDCKGCQMLRSEITSLRAQASDQHELILRMLSQHAEERKQLVEQIMAYSNPAVLREYRRPEPERAKIRVNGEATRPNFPGFQPDLRPRLKPVDEAEG